MPWLLFLAAWVWVLDFTNPRAVVTTGLGTCAHCAAADATPLAQLRCQTLNVFGLGFERSFGAYLLGLILLLALGSMHFVLLLMGVHKARATRSD